jgi:hypothetical protein
MLAPPDVGREKIAGSSRRLSVARCQVVNDVQFVAATSTDPPFFFGEGPPLSVIR